MMRFLSTLALATMLPLAATAADIGHYHYTFGPFSVYDATLSATTGSYSPQQPFELTITYLRGIPGSRISGGSLKEWKKQGYSPVQINAWAPQLQTLMPNVTGGDVIRSVHTAGGGVEVYKNGQRLGGSQSPAFATAYFNLWLGPNSSEPEQRDALLGQAE